MRVCVCAHAHVCMRVCAHAHVCMRVCVCDYMYRETMQACKQA